MKKIGMKINFLFAAALFVVALTVGCKKEEDSDPNIASKSYNVSLTNTTSAIDSEQEAILDIDGDGLADFRIEAQYQNVGGDTSITQLGLHSTSMDNKVLTEDYIFPGGQSANKLRALANGFLINSSSESHESGFAELTAKKGVTSLGDFGFTDGSDKLIGFSFLIGTEKHYGWLKVNVSSDLKTMTVKDGAYHKIADTGIGAGDK